MQRASIVLVAVMLAAPGAALGKPLPAADFLDANADLDAITKQHPRLAKIVRAGARYESRDAAHQEPEAQAILEPVAVLEETDKRLRVLCSEHTHRIAAWLDVADLATVAKRDLVLTHKLPVMKKATADAVGIHVRSGTILDEIEAKSPGVAHANVRGLFFVADGYASAGSIGVSYLPSSVFDARSNQPLDGEIAPTLDVYDAPAGAAIAHIEKPDGEDDTLYVRKLATQGAWVKLAYDESDLAVVGWAKRADVHWFEKPLETGSQGYGTGSGSGSYVHFIEAKKGMRLVGRSSGETIGVVLEDTKLRMGSGSTDDAPVAQVSACGGTIEVAVRAR